MKKLQKPLRVILTISLVVWSAGALLAPINFSQAVATANQFTLTSVGEVSFPAPSTTSLILDLSLPGPSNDTTLAGTAPTAGTAVVLTEPANWNLFFYDKTNGGVWATGDDWVGVDDDADAVYTSAADTLVDADGTATAGTGTTALVAATALYDIAAADLVVADNLTTPTKVWQDLDNSVQYTGTFTARSTVSLAGDDGDIGAAVEALTNVKVQGANGVLDANEGVYVSADTTLDATDTIILGETVEALTNTKLTGADGNYNLGEAVYAGSADTIVNAGDVRATAYTGNGGVNWAANSQSGTITSSADHGRAVNNVIKFTTLASDTAAAYVVASVPLTTTLTVDGSGAQILGAGSKLTPQTLAAGTETTNATAAANVVIAANTESPNITLTAHGLTAGNVIKWTLEGTGNCVVGGGTYVVTTVVDVNTFKIIGPTGCTVNASKATPQTLTAGTESTYTLSSGAAANKAARTAVAAGDGDYNLSIPNTLTNAKVTAGATANILDANEGVYQSADTTYDAADTIVLGSVLAALTNGKLTIIGTANGTREAGENVYVAVGATVANADTRVNAITAESCVLGVCANGDNGTNVAATAGWVKELNATWSVGNDVFIENYAGELTYSAAADTKLAGTNPAAGTVITTTKDTDWTTMSFYDKTGGGAWDNGNDWLGLDDDESGYYRGDKLTSIKVLNTGSADASDLVSLKVWQDDTTAGWGGGTGETNIGTLTSVFWNQTITVASNSVFTATSAPKRVFITVNISPSATDMRTFGASIPLSGVVLASTNDGPSDVAITNLSKQRIVVARVTDTTPPAAPSNLKVSDPKTGGTLNLSWTNPSDADLSYLNIYRSTTATSLGSRIYAQVSGTSKTDTGLVNGTTYYYTVRAVDTSGNESTNTNQASGKPTTVVPVSAAKSTLEASPLELSADGTTFSTVTVTIKDADSNPLSGYKVTLSSSRGATDTITTLTGTTGTDGKASFKIISLTTGEATLTAQADSTAITQVVKVTFVAPVTAGEITPIPLPKVSEAKLVKSPASSTVYLIENGQKKIFPHSNVFKSKGYSFTQVEAISSSDLAGYTAGDDVKFRDGSLVRDLALAKPAVYLVSEGRLRPVKSGEIFLNLGYKWNKITWLTTSFLDKYEKGTVIDSTDIHSSGSLVKYTDKTAVYLIDQGLKRAFKTGEAFTSRGFSWADIITIPTSETYSDGVVIE